MSKKSLFLALVLYIVSAIGSYAIFARVGSSTVVVPEGGETTQQAEGDDSSLLGALLQIDPNEPRDQVCPINGRMYTKTEKDAWSARRPLFVMIENTPDARPQSGLSKADAVFEAVAEGGVTRFGAIFYCGAQYQDLLLAPIRSARIYFVDWASGFNLPMYVHVGGANVPGPSDALGKIGDYGWELNTDINQFSVGYPTFYRDYNRVEGKEIATEHTMVTSTEKLWAVAAKRGWTNMSPERKLGKKTVPGSDWKDGYTGWTFEETASAKGNVSTVAYDFWSGYSDYSVKWTYDSTKDVFLREVGGDKHTDLNDGQQIASSNVIVLFTKEEGPINEKKHMLYQTTGKGEALLFKHGSAEKITWVKKTRESELEFNDAKGKQVELARGQVWISVVDVSNEVQY
ncbi:MAG: DUF3048 domain-containing protein [Patescibacteria group bacterium]